MKCPSIQGRSLAMVMTLILIVSPATVMMADLAVQGTLVENTTDGIRGQDTGQHTSVASPMDVRASMGNSDTIDSTGTNNQRKLLRDASGTLHAIFTRNGEIHYTNSSDGGISWVSSRDLTNGSTTSQHASLALSGSVLHAVWQDGPNISYRRSDDLGGSWSPPLAQAPVLVTADPINWPASPVVAASDNHLVIAWSGHSSTSGSYEIALSTSSDGGETLSVDYFLTSNGLSAARPSICANGTDYFLAFQEGQPGQKEIMMRSSTDYGSTWGGSTNVSNNAGNSVQPSIAEDGTSLYLSWVDNSGNNPEILFKSSADAGQTWDVNAQLISNNPSRSLGPTISVAQNDDVYVVWYDDREHPHNDTLVRRYNSSDDSWDDTILLSDLDMGHNHPVLNPYAVDDRIEWLYVYGRQPSYNIKYDWYVIGENTPPTLEWIGEGNYENTGLYPEAGGTTAHTYTFKIKYTDVDNNEPLNGVRVLVDYDQNGWYDFHDDNENRKMTEAEFWDDDFRDGKDYIHSMKFPGLGTDYRYRFYVRDSINNLATGNGTDSRNYPDIEHEDEPPRLFWTNEKGYSSDGVEPSTGTTSTNFTWHVSYFDEDNDEPMPGYPKVMIDLDNNTVFSQYEFFNMTEVDPQDTAYDDGKFYTFSRTLPDVGVYLYKFIARDIWTIPNPSSDKPSDRISGPTVTAINTPPHLHFPEDANFSDDGLFPDSGSTSRIFTFRVNYTDDEDNPPAEGYPKVWIDRNLNGIFTSDEKYSMTEEDDSDSTYHDGKFYRYEATYSALGTYIYKFEARDIHGQQATGATVAQMDGPDITKVNDAPVLDWPRVEGYMEDGVYPEDGRNTTLFTFMVLYSDPNGDEPLEGYPKLHLDLNRDQFIQPHEIFGMSVRDQTGGTYEEGKLYVRTMTLEEEGRYAYRFEAWDGFDGLATGPATELVGGPDVSSSTNNPPVLDWPELDGYRSDGIHPDSGPNTETFLYKVNYLDYDDDPPEEGHPRLYLDLNGNGDYNDSNERQAMWEEDVNDTDFTDGKMYIYETTLTTSFTMPGSSYTYLVFARDSRGSAAIGPATTKMFGPNITSGNSPPQLVWPGDLNYENDGLHPENGNSTTEFVFRVKYIDEDNDQPAQNSPRVFLDNDPVGKTMVKEDPSDDDYTDGVIYVYNTTLDLGEHKYRFVAFDKFLTKAPSTDPPLSVTEGPLVEENEPPVLSWPPGEEFEAGVSPSTGPVGKTFSFRVIYTDAEDEAPAQGYPLLLLDRNDDGDYDDPLERLTMMKDTGTDYSAGVSYTLEVLIEKGEHTYRFEAKDRKDNWAAGEPTEEVEDRTVKVTERGEVAGDMGVMTYAIFVVVIVVVAIVCLVLGRKMGGSPVAGAAPEEEAQQVQAQDYQGQKQATYQQPQEGYGYQQQQYGSREVEEETVGTSEEEPPASQEPPPQQPASQEPPPQQPPQSSQTQGTEPPPPPK